MNPYVMVASGLGSADAAALSAQLSAWHDAMVAHERRLRAGTGEGCDDECPHAEAPALWAEAVASFGARANELRFLRSHRGARNSSARRPNRAPASPPHGSGRLSAEL